MNAQASLSATLGRLVAFPTVSRDSNLDCARHIADRLDSAGFRVHLQTDDSGAKANVIACAGPEIPGGLALSGHMDVVPTTGQNWSTDPFTLVEGRAPGDEPAFFGRGTCDMKGFIACALETAVRVEADQLKKPLWLLFTHDEEVGCLGAVRLVSWLAQRGLAPEHAVVGEPTDLAPVRAHKGHLQATIVLRGIGGHSSDPSRGVSAIAFAGRVLAALERHAETLAGRRSYERAFPDVPHPVINVGVIQGGAAVNMIPERCELRLGYRLMPGEDPAAVLSEIRGLLEEEVGAALRRAGVSDGLRVIAGPAPCGMHVPAGSALEKALSAATGLASSERGVSFTTEGGMLLAAGVTPIICGPGSINQAHQPDEYVTAAQLFRGLEMVERTVSRLCRDEA